MLDIDINQMSEEQQKKEQKGKKINKNKLDVQKLTREELIKLITELDQQNRRLKNRVAEHEPLKQRVLREPNKNKLQKLFEQYEQRKFALKVCYIGTNYDGMSCQSLNDNTVEHYIFQAMLTLSLIPTALPCNYTRAGRTDKGVSAMGNVIALPLRTDLPKVLFPASNVVNLLPSHIESSNTFLNNEQKHELKQAHLQNSKQGKDNQFESIEQQHKLIEVIQKKTLLQSKEQGKRKDVRDYCRMLNAILPQDIRILACEEVSVDFNARYWCTRRSYKYFFACANLNIEAMSVCIGDFVGTHNFLNYCKMNVTNTVNFQRTIFQAKIVKVDLPLGDDYRNDIYYFHFVGNSFLWHQIRLMASVLFLVGRGQEPRSIIKDLFDLNKFPIKPNYVMAPQYPLILEDCCYDGLNFKPSVSNTVQFYNVFNEMVMRKSVEQVLYLNCMLLAKHSLLQSSTITNDQFKQQSIRCMRNLGHCRLSMQKPSARGLNQTIQALKGKKLLLYNIKAQKQALYQKKLKHQFPADQ